MLYARDFIVRTIYVHKSQLTSKIKITPMTMLQLNDTDQRHGVSRHYIHAATNLPLLFLDV